MKKWMALITVAVLLVLHLSAYAMEVTLPLEEIDKNYKVYKDDAGNFHTVCVYDTGMEYLKIDYMNNGVDLYKSNDWENWEYIKFISEDIMYEHENYLYSFPGNSGGQSPLQITNTGNSYLVISTSRSNSLPYYVPSSSFIIAVYDLDFNYVRSIDFGDAYIVKMAYLDGVCYVTLSDSKTYRSSDLETWEELYDGIGIPLSNGETTIYTTHIRKDSAQRTGDLLFQQDPITAKNGQPDKFVAVDQLDMQTTDVYGTFFVNYDNRDAERFAAFDNSTIEKMWEAEKNRREGKTFPARLSFSKDGVYWATVTLPEEINNKISYIEEEKDGIVIIAGNTYRLKYSDMESVVPRCDTYVQVKDEILGFDTPPVTESDRTLVPMRFLFEKLGADVTWDEATQTATATIEPDIDDQFQTFGTARAKSVSVSIDNTTAVVNGQARAMDVPARMVNDRTLVPLRFLSENLGYTVTWDEATNTAIVE